MSEFFTTLGDAVAGAQGFVYDFSVGGVTAWTVRRPSGNGVSASVTLATRPSPVTAAVIDNTGSRMQQAAAGIGVFAANWLIYAAAGADIRAGDILTDSAALAFTVLGQPANDQGFLLAPAAPCEVPS